jgi:Rhodopirellula transposase DDE domain
VREFVVTDEGLTAMLTTVLPHLDERQRRVLVGSAARVLGRGGIAAVAEASGMSRSTVQKAVGEIDAGVEVSVRVRPPGAGRPRVEDAQPGLLVGLDALVEPEARGDPMCPLRWTAKSTRTLAGELRVRGFEVSHVTVGDLLHRMGYSRQAPAKENEGAAHPDRDAQFRHIARHVRTHLKAGQPVVSVDTKKKEVVGNLNNGGREWQPTGVPVRVDVHDFPDPEVGKAIPYGVFDVAANEGFVVVGDDADTAEFAVTTIGRWWDEVGSVAYPDATRLLITADAGGSNGYRNRLWKLKLGALAARTGLKITVCHLPPGTSKWSKIEHRLFSAISMNWRGRPLTSHQVVVDLIANTTTRTGLKVRAQLDEGYYPTGVKVTDKQLAAVPITPHSFHGDWNYTLKPMSPDETSTM